MIISGAQVVRRFLTFTLFYLLSDDFAFMLSESVPHSYLKFDYYEYPLGRFCTVKASDEQGAFVHIVAKPI